MFASLSWYAAAMQRPGPPAGPPHPPNVQQRLSDVRQKLSAQRPVNVSAERALQYAKRYLDRAEQAYGEGHASRADRVAAAADSLIHIAEHQEHLMSAGGPKGSPPPHEIEEHLHFAYFRIRQADYFLAQSHDSVVAAQLPEWARGFYELAVRAYDRKQWIAADENAKCAEEVVKALENLAQAASITSSGPPRPPLPKPPPS